MRRYSLKGNKIYFDEEFFIDLNKQTIAEYELQKRNEISEEEYYEIIRRRVLSMGYFLLSKKDYPIKEFTTKLVTKYREKEIVEEIIDEFIEKGYLDDMEYGRCYIKIHNYGRKKMEFMLFQKGLSSDIIRELLNDNSDNEMEEIKRLWLRLGEKEKDKKIVSLMRKGFQYRDIKKVISELE